MSKTSLQVVQSFQISLGSGTGEWENLISEDITFDGPVDHVKGKMRFIELNRNFFPMVRGYEPINAFESRDFVCLEGKFRVASPSGKVLEMLMAEVYTVKNGKIKSVRVYYDAEEFRKEFGAGGA